MSPIQEKIYQKISTYLDLAEDLVLLAENSQNKNPKVQFELIERFVMHLQSHSDQLSILYLDFVKNGKSKKNIAEIRKVFNEISAITQEYRDRIINL